MRVCWCAHLHIGDRSARPQVSVQSRRRASEPSHPACGHCRKRAWHQCCDTQGVLWGQLSAPGRISQRAARCVCARVCDVSACSWCTIFLHTGLVMDPRIRCFFLMWRHKILSCFNRFSVVISVDCLLVGAIAAATGRPSVHSAAPIPSTASEPARPAEGSTVRRRSRPAHKVQTLLTVQPLPAPADSPAAGSPRRPAASTPVRHQSPVPVDHQCSARGVCSRLPPEQSGAVPSAQARAMLNMIPPLPLDVCHHPPAPPTPPPRAPPPPPQHRGEGGGGGAPRGGGALHGGVLLPLLPSPRHHHRL